MANGLNKQVSLNVDKISKIPSLENALKSGRINIILVFAEWCGACHKFRKNIWDPMLQKNAMHNRIAVRDDMIGKTSLRGANFDYLPSILVVDEKGVAQVFNTPEGKTTNATPTPKNLTDMLKMVNVPVKPLASPAAPANAPMANAPMANAPMANAPMANAPMANAPMANAPMANAPPAPAPSPPANADPTALMEEISANIRRNNALNTTMNQGSNINMNIENISNTMLLNESPLNSTLPNNNKQSAIPQGIVFTPTPLVAPQRGGQQGGSLLAALQSTAQGVVPASVLGSLVIALRGGRRRKTKRAPARSKIDRRTRRHK